MHRIFVREGIPWLPAQLFPVIQAHWVQEEAEDFPLVIHLLKLVGMGAMG
ncbi:hypothetical protein [Pantoea ananatis]|nr:hypothetical protein [Pantoea ananatis]